MYKHTICAMLAAASFAEVAYVSNHQNAQDYAYAKDYAYAADYAKDYAYAAYNDY